jgi:hypothetical protein
MVENFSPVIFLYGMAIVLAVGKVFTMTIWRTLPRPRPPLREEVFEAWTRRRPDSPVAKGAAAHEQGRSTAEESVSSADEVEEASDAAVSDLEQASVTQPGPNTPPESR